MLIYRRNRIRGEGFETKKNETMKNIGIPVQSVLASFLFSACFYFVKKIWLRNQYRLRANTNHCARSCSAPFQMEFNIFSAFFIATLRISWFNWRKALLLSVLPFFSWWIEYIAFVRPYVVINFNRPNYIHTVIFTYLKYPVGNVRFFALPKPNRFKRFCFLFNEPATNFLIRNCPATATPFGFHCDFASVPFNFNT